MSPPERIVLVFHRPIRVLLSDQRTPYSPKMYVAKASQHFCGSPRFFERTSVEVERRHAWSSVGVSR
eukprot:scaffold213580_cov20-Attheya_sp.AAC.1